MEYFRTSSRFFVVSLLVIIASAAFASAHIGEYDEYWQKRAAASHARADAAYHPDPESLSESFTNEVAEGMIRNGTRRGLRNKHVGPCAATNPIDRCWRCRKNWATPAQNRKRLARCAKGFGRFTTGGKDGDIYVVTDGADDRIDEPRYGTLRWGVIQDRPLWIIFARDMIIRLSEELMINSNKTIDGRGANVHIAYGAGLTVQMVENVIIHNIHIHDIKSGGGGMIRDSEHHIGFRTRSDGDGISIFTASNVWIDHVSMSNCEDGILDAIQGSTAITVSNSHFTRHNDVMLFGANDKYEPDAKMQVTVAFNHFGRGLVQRMPRCRWGFFHVLNNDYTHWLMYAIGGSQNPTIISQGNRYTAPPNQAAKQVTMRNFGTQAEWQHWSWRSYGDLLRNGAFFVESGAPSTRTFDKKDFIKYKPGTYVSRLTRYTGTLRCRVGKSC